MTLESRLSELQRSVDELRAMVSELQQEVDSLKKRGGGWSGGLDAGWQIAQELNAVRRDIEELRSQATLSQAPQVAQVFVDLPEATTVQLAFRAKQFSASTDL
jgi:predicted RNase H-like nuclease (RuvC/YqgF family)